MSTDYGLSPQGIATMLATEAIRTRTAIRFSGRYNATAVQRAQDLDACAILIENGASASGYGDVLRAEADALDAVRFASVDEPARLYQVRQYRRGTELLEQAAEVAA